MLETIKKKKIIIIIKVLKKCDLMRHWYVEKIWFRDMLKTWAKTAKGSLFTGAQASKSRKKHLFNTSLSIFQITEIDILRTFKSEICSKLERAKTAKGALFTGAQVSKMPGKPPFRKFVDMSETNFVNTSMSRICKMRKDVLKRCFFWLYFAWALVNKEFLAVFAQVLSKTLKQLFSINQSLWFGRCSEMC